MSDDGVVRQSDAERRHGLQGRLGQLRRLMDDGTIDDPAVAPLVQSLKEGFAPRLRARSAVLVFAAGNQTGERNVARERNRQRV